jgi:hypothetical protein
MQSLLPNRVAMHEYLNGLISLMRLNLGGTQIEGTISPSLGNLTSLTHLRLIDFSSTVQLGLYGKFCRTMTLPLLGLVALALLGTAEVGIARLVRASSSRAQSGAAPLLQNTVNK